MGYSSQACESGSCHFWLTMIPQCARGGYQFEVYSQPVPTLLLPWLNLFSVMEALDSPPSCGNSASVSVQRGIDPATNAG